MCVCVCFVSVRWAEKELHMMKLFFDNLQHYIQEVREHRHKFALWVAPPSPARLLNIHRCSLNRLLPPRGCRYSHSAEVQVRLQFLTCVFSTLGSPDHFSKTRLLAFGKESTYLEMQRQSLIVTIILLYGPVVLMKATLRSPFPALCRRDWMNQEVETSK